MAIQQIDQSFQNDGNFNLLDLKDINFSGPTMRIETFRASHPAKGDFFKTAAGTSVEFLAGEDHLREESNQTFRHVFSVEDTRSNEMIVTLEFREKFYEDGSWDVKMRDVDYRSQSYGAIITCLVSPCKGRQRGNYKLDYKIFNPSLKKATKIVSPLKDRITSLDGRLADTSNNGDVLGKVLVENTVFINLKTTQLDIEEMLGNLSEILRSKLYTTFVNNVEVYQRFGDFRDKCIHSGQNLIGENPQLASEYILVRAYRSSMIVFGRLFDRKMAKREYLTIGFSLWNERTPLSFDPKPGVYSVFILAHILGLEIYQLGLDKVHSDYGGIPMKLSPGSMLENGEQPIKSAFRANRTLAEIAVALYEPYTATLLK